MTVRIRLWLALLALAALAVTAGGCLSPRAKPAPNQTGTLDSINPGDDISSLIRDRMKDRDEVNTIVVGNIAVVGLGNGRTTQPSAPTAPSPGGGAPPAGTPGMPTEPTTPPPSGTTPARPDTKNIGVLDRTIVSEITQRFPQIAQVQSTDEPALVERIISIARDLRNRRPIDDRADELAWLVRVTAPMNTMTPSRTGMNDRRTAP